MKGYRVSPRAEETPRGLPISREIENRLGLLSRPETEEGRAFSDLDPLSCPSNTARSRRNETALGAILDTYGADALRWHLLT